MKRPLMALLAIAIVASVVGAGMLLIPSGEEDRETLYQVSTLEALMEGKYDGIRTVGDLKANGDIGLGTFDSIDGEMIFLEGVCYQVTSDGQVHVMDDGEGVPFACVSYMDADIQFDIECGMNLSQLEGFIGEKLPNQDFFVIQIDGEFEDVLVRSVPRQEKPFPPLVDVIANQTKFHYQNISGTIVGIWSPSFVGEINAAGFHFHFISDDRTVGGHLLGCDVLEGSGMIDDTPRLELEMR